MRKTREKTAILNGRGSGKREGLRLLRKVKMQKSGAFVEFDHEHREFALKLVRSLGEKIHMNSDGAFRTDT